LAGIGNKKRHANLQRIRNGEEMSGILVASVLGAHLHGMADAAGASLSRNGSSSCTTDCCSYFTDEGKRMKEHALFLVGQPLASKFGKGDEVGAGERGEGSPLGCPHRGCAHKAVFGDGSSKAKAVLEIATHHMVEHVLEEDDVKKLIINLSADINKKTDKKS
jgi:hypothetical protein